MPRSRLVDRLRSAGFHRPSPDRGVLDLNGVRREGSGLEFFYSQAHDGQHGLKVWKLCDGVRLRVIWTCVTLSELLAVAGNPNFCIAWPETHVASLKSLNLIAVIGENRLGDAAILREEHSPQGGPASECASSGN